MFRRIPLLSSHEVKQLEKSCQLAADTLLMISEHIAPGISTEDINRIVHEYITKHGAYPSPLNYHGFPKSVCTSINEVVCHGIPSEKEVLKDGDIINVDVTTTLPSRNGWYGDTSATFYVGEASPIAKHVTEVCREALEIGIAMVKPGVQLGDIGHAIQTFAESKGCSVVRDYTGHGIGREFHIPPTVHHVGPPGSGTRLKKGMAFTIEPMINVGTAETEQLDDGWTVLTRDRSLSAQFEHTVVVTRNGVKVLTKRKGQLKHSEDKPWNKLGHFTTWNPEA